MLNCLKRLAMVGALSSMAIRPLPFATIALAVAFNSALFMTCGPPGSARIGSVNRWGLTRILYRRPGHRHDRGQRRLPPRDVCRWIAPFVVGTSPGRRLPVRRRDFPPGSPSRIWLLASFSGANLHRYDYV